MRCCALGESQKEVNWLDQLAGECPIFDKLPDRIRDPLPDTPAPDVENTKVKEVAGRGCGDPSVLAPTKAMI